MCLGVLRGDAFYTRLIDPDQAERGDLLRAHFGRAQKLRKINVKFS